MNFFRAGSCNGLLSNWLQGISQISTDTFPVGPHCQWVITCVDCTDKNVVYYPVLWVCDYFTLWSLASSLFTGTEQSLWFRPCSRWLRWRFSAWWPLVQLETAVALLQRLFRAGACTRTNHVFATMRSLQCNQCQESMRQINPNGFQSLCYSMYDYDFVAINIFELSWVELSSSSPIIHHPFTNTMLYCIFNMITHKTHYGSCSNSVALRVLSS